MKIKRIIVWTYQGCLNLPGYGHHPGTVYLVSLLILGALAGSDGGLIGALTGTGLMASTFGMIYLIGAYGRAKDYHSHDNQNQNI